jgi:hypothetical protein
MITTTTVLADEHRGIEAELDRFSVSLAAGHVDGECFGRINGLIVQHYRGEDLFLAQLRKHAPRFADKLKGQHEEALEVADRLEESLALGNAGDATYLARRLLAIVQHNIIEEERDAFPLAERCFLTEVSGGEGDSHR